MAVVVVVVVVGKEHAHSVMDICLARPWRHVGPSATSIAGLKIYIPTPDRGFSGGGGGEHCKYRSPFIELIRSASRQPRLPVYMSVCIL